MSLSINNLKTILWHSELFHRKQTSMQSIRTLKTQIKKISGKKEFDMKDSVPDKKIVKYA